MKRCTKCGEEKPIAEFNRNRATRDGLFAHCRDCQSETKRKWYAANKEKAADYWSHWYADNKEDLLERRKPKGREWYAANRDKVLQKRRAWYVANRQRACDYSRGWRAANKERHLAYVHQWQSANPERVREFVRAGKLRRRAREHNAEGTHTAADIKAQYARQNGKCYYCHVKVGDRYHVDHVIPLSRGGSNGPENIVIACPSCNTSKSDKLPHEWAQGGRLI